MKNTSEPQLQSLIFGPTITGKMAQAFPLALEYKHPFMKMSAKIGQIEARLRFLIPASFLSDELDRNFIRHPSVNNLTSFHPQVTMGPKDIYLVAYNTACCLGWALVWKLAVESLVGSLTDQLPLKEALSSVYASTANALWYSQTAALLEIAHSMVGLVRSPVMVTVMQVMSRIVALIAIVYAPSAQSTL